MDNTQFFKKAIQYAVANAIDSTGTDSTENPKVVAETLSICLRRIKEIDQQNGENNAERQLWVDLFWEIAPHINDSKNR
jgi:hypothetical protein